MIASSIGWRVTRRSNDPLDDESVHTESTDTPHITRWIITLLTIFQSRSSFLTNSSLDWFLRFIVVLLKYLGKYSPEIAANLPQSMLHYDCSLECLIDLHNFILKCDTLYKFEDCFKKTAFNSYQKLFL